MGKPWVSMDLDGTLAYYDHDRGLEPIGDPIPQMVDVVKAELAAGYEVRILTARVAHDGTPQARAFADRQRRLVEAWCQKHLGRALKVTAQKDFGMIRGYDDRITQVLTNRGVLVLPSPGL